MYFANINHQDIHGGGAGGGAGGGGLYTDRTPVPHTYQMQFSLVCVNTTKNQICVIHV
jgi:hypothetical protein